MATSIIELAKTRALQKHPTMKSWRGVQGGVYHLVQTMDQFWEFHQALKLQKTIAIDTETSGFDHVRAMPCGIVVGWGIDHNYYLPIAHKTGEPQLDIEQIRDPLNEVFQDPSVVSVFWNEKFDRHFLRKVGLEVRGVRHDGVVLVHLLDENTEKALKVLSKRYIDQQADLWEKAVAEWRGNEAKRRRKEYSEFINAELKRRRPELEQQLLTRAPFAKFSGMTKAQVTAKFKKQLREETASHPLASNKKDDVSYDYVPLEIIVPYACADVHYTLLLYKDLVLKVAGHDELRKLYVNEMQLADLLFEVESRGIQIDVPYLAGLQPQYEKEIADFRAEIMQDVGFEFNVDSNPQLVEAMQKVGVRLSKLTKGGKELFTAGGKLEPKHFSVDNETLEHLATTHPFAKKIQDYRQKQKLLNTYVLKIQQLVDDQHYLHSTFNANVSTGRMSSREPNVQNIPARRKDIRRAFTVPLDITTGQPHPEWVMVLLDYSQVELRLTAHHSQDPTLIAAYPWHAPAQDVHSITCAEVVMDMSLDNFMAIYGDESHPEYEEYKWFRNIAKRVNFGIIYGAGPGAIQRQVSTPQRQVSRDECQEYIDKYLQKYVGVKEWIDRTQFALERYGFLQNTFGRFRRLPDAKSKERWKQGRAGRQGVNFLIQGDAADLFKHAAVRVRKVLQDANARTKIVNFVHDEIQLYWHREELHLLPAVKAAMEDFSQYSMPIVVDIEVAQYDWAHRKSVHV